MATSRGKGQSEPLTLGQALAARVRLIVWCRSCDHRASPMLPIRSRIMVRICRFPIGRGCYGAHCIVTAAPHDSNVHETASAGTRGPQGHILGKAFVIILVS